MLAWQRHAWGWLLCLCALGAASPLMAAQSMMLTQALVVEAGPSTEGQAVHLARAVQLPYLWDKEHPGASGMVEVVLHFAMPDIAQEQYGLYASKMANAYAVSLNGVLLDRFGVVDAYGVGDSKLPRLLPFSHVLLRPQNEVRILLRGDAGRQGGLSPLLLAPLAQARAVYDDMWLYRGSGRVVVIVFSALVGVLGLALWATQLRRNAAGRLVRERLYLYGGLAELCWVFRVFDSITELPPLPMAWWSICSSLALGGWACLTAVFGLELLGAAAAPLLRPWRRSLLILWGLGIAAAIAGWVYLQPLVLTAWYLALGLAFMVFAFQFARLVLRPGVEWSARALMLAIVVNVVVGVVDLYLFRIAPSTVWRGGLYFSSILFGLAAGMVVLMRFRQLTHQANDFSAMLAARLVQREVELKDSYAQLQALAGEQARVAERTRILRDMHDGVGAHISAAIRQLQGGLAGKDEVVLTLQESLDQLKLSIDSMHLPAGDLNSVLANVRYRMESRLLSSGIRVVWDVDSLPLLARWDEKAMRQFQFMVYECISNVLQHAQATEICIRARDQGPHAQVSFIDNGRGFDMNAEGSRGLQSLRQRAQALGVQLQLRSRPGETSVDITVAWG